MRISLLTNIFSYKLPPEEARKWTWSEKMAAYIIELGYDGVELSAKRHLNLDRVLSGEAGEVRRIAEKYGLEITALAAHYNHLHPDKELRKKYNDNFLKTIEVASLLDVPIVVTFSGMQYPFNIFYPYPESNIDELEKAWGEFKEVWGCLVDHAASHDVKIAIEAHFGHLVYNTQTVARMFEEMPSKTIGLNFDPSHYVWQLIDPMIIVERFGDRIYHVHAKDVEFDNEKLKENGLLATGKWISEERSWRFRIPGKGVIDWKKLVQSLLSKGYRGTLSFEHEDPILDLEKGAKEASRFLRGLLEELKRR